MVVGDLEQFKTLRVQRRQPLGDVVEPKMADAVVAKFLEHLGLLFEVAFLAVVGVDAEGEKRFKHGLHALFLRHRPRSQKHANQSHRTIGFSELLSCSHLK